MTTYRTFLDEQLRRRDEIEGAERERLRRQASCITDTCHCTTLAATDERYLEPTQRGRVQSVLHHLWLMISGARRRPLSEHS